MYKWQKDNKIIFSATYNGAQYQYNLDELQLEKLARALVNTHILSTDVWLPFLLRFEENGFGANVDNDSGVSVKFVIACCWPGTGGVGVDEGVTPTLLVLLL